MSAPCGRVRRVLWPDGGPRSTSADVVAAQAHLAGCAECQQFIREMRAMSEAIAAGAPRVAAPADVRDRLFAAVARARTAMPPARSRHHVTIGVAVALVVALGAAVGGILFQERTTRSGEAPSVIAALAEDHARAMSDARIASRDASEIARWLAARLPFAVHVPDLAEAELRGARLCLMDGRRGAVIEYQVGGEPLSYFVLPDARVPVAPTEIRFEHTARIGYGIVWWREPGLMHAMVGRLPTSRLEHFARLCVKQMQTALARLGLERSGSSWRDA